MSLEGRTVVASVEGAGGEFWAASGVLIRFYVMHGAGGNYMGGSLGEIQSTLLLSECAYISIFKYIEKCSNLFNVYQ